MGIWHALVKLLDCQVWSWEGTDGPCPFDTDWGFPLLALISLTVSSFSSFFFFLSGAVYLWNKVSDRVVLGIRICFRYMVVADLKGVDYDDGYHRFNWLNMTGRGRECDWLLLNRFPGRPTDQREVCPAPHHAPYASYGQWSHMRYHTQGNLITRIRSPNSSTRVALIPHIFHFYMPTQFHIHQCIICNKNCRLMTKQCWSVLLSEDFLFDNIH